MESTGSGSNQPLETSVEVQGEPPSLSPDSITLPESEIASSGAGSDEDEGVDLLSRIELRSFTADPSTVEPWGGSVLRWAVSGPHVATIKLNGRSVPYTGQVVVRPTFRTNYKLSAHAGSVHATLAGIDVDVDFSSCSITGMLNGNIAQILDFALRRFVEDSQMDDYPLRFRPETVGYGQTRPGGPIITIDSEGVRFRLPMRARLNNKPDPTVDVDAHFTAEAAPEMPGPILSTGKGRVVPVFHKLQVDIGFPWWVWGVPGLMYALPIIIGNVEADARASIRTGMEEFLNELLPLVVPDGMRVHSLTFSRDTMDVRSCRDPLIGVVTH